MDADEEDESLQPPPVIFINRVDTYFGTILAQHLSQCKPSATTNESDSSIKLKDFTFLTAEARPECFQVIGSYRPLTTRPDPLIPTSKAPQLPEVPGVVQLFSVDSLNTEVIKEADLLIYHICDDDEENQLFSDTEMAFSLIKDLVAIDKRKRRLILVSDLMTWCNTKRKAQPQSAQADEPEEEEEAEVFTEDDFRKRRPHPDFYAHLEFEKTFLNSFKEKEMKKLVKTSVVAAGLVYGLGEGSLHWLFKDAWHNEPFSPTFGDFKGKNLIPMIHARDLAQIVQNMCDTKPEVRYIIAITGSQTQHELAECLSKSLTTGAVEQVPAENVHELKRTENRRAKKILSSDFPHLTGKAVVQSMKIKWTAEEGFLKAINKVIHEYKVIRNLLPIKVDIVGPPFSGKTTLAKKIANFYKIHHIVVDEVISSALENLTSKSKPPPVIENPSPSDQPPNVEGTGIISVETTENQSNEEELEETKAAKQLLSDIETEKLSNNGVLPDRFVVQFLREKLLSKPCQNQGYVLDGVPKNYTLAKELFGISEEGEAPREEEHEDAEEDEPKETSENEEVFPVDKRIFPENIFYLDIDEDHLRKRYRDQADLAGKLPTDQGNFDETFTKYNAENPEEQNVLSFFDEAENHAQWVDLSKDKTSEMLETVMTLVEKIGRPRNYEPTTEEKTKHILEKEVSFLKQYAADNADINIRKEPPSAPLSEQDQWTTKLEILRIEDYAKRELKAMSPIAYLMKYVFPSLQEALQQTARVMPDNPVDYFAELLISSTQPRRIFETSASKKKSSVRKEEGGSGDVEDLQTSVTDTVETSTEGNIQGRTSASFVPEDIFHVGGIAHMIPRRSSIMIQLENRQSEVGLSSGRAHRISDFGSQ